MVINEIYHFLFSFGIQYFSLLSPTPFVISWSSFSISMPLIQWWTLMERSLCVGTVVNISATAAAPTGLDWPVGAGESFTEEVIFMLGLMEQWKHDGEEKVISCRGKSISKVTKASVSMWAWGGMGGMVRQRPALGPLLWSLDVILQWWQVVKGSVFRGE